MGENLIREWKILLGYKEDGDGEYIFADHIRIAQIIKLDLYSVYTSGPMDHADAIILTPTGLVLEVTFRAGALELPAEISPGLLGRLEDPPELPYVDRDRSRGNVLVLEVPGRRLHYSYGEITAVVVFRDRGDPGSVIYYRRGPSVTSSKHTLAFVREHGRYRQVETTRDVVARVSAVLPVYDTGVRPEVWRKYVPLPGQDYPSQEQEEVTHGA